MTSMADWLRAGNRLPPIENTSWGGNGSFNMGNPWLTPEQNFAPDTYSHGLGGLGASMPHGGGWFSPGISAVQQQGPTPLQRQAYALMQSPQYQPPAPAPTPAPTPAPAAAAPFVPPAPPPKPAPTPMPAPAQTAPSNPYPILQQYISTHPSFPTAHLVGANGWRPTTSAPSTPATNRWY